MEVVANLNAEGLEYILSYAWKYCSANEAGPQSCPYCGKTEVIRYGRKRGKQRFLCKDCNHTFASTVNTVMYHSRQDRKGWNEVIRDTLKGESREHNRLRLRKDCDAKISYRSLFFKRHKLLIALEAVPESREPVAVTVSSESGSVKEVFEAPSVFLTDGENRENHEPETRPDERRLLPNAALKAGTVQAEARAEDSVWEMDEAFVPEYFKGVKVTSETHGRGSGSVGQLPTGAAFQRSRSV